MQETSAYSLCGSPGIGHTYVGGDEIGDVGIFGTVMFLQGTADSALEPSMFSDACEVDSICALACLRIWRRFPLAIGSCGWDMVLLVTWTR